jgi:hypothetical protein
MDVSFPTGAGRPRCALAISMAVVTAFPLVGATARADVPPVTASKERPAEQAATAPTASTPPHEAEATVGAVLNGGNVQGAAVRIGGFYATRRGIHAVRADLALGLAALAIDADGDPANGFTRLDADGTARPATMLDNVNSTAGVRVRYDVFVAEATSIYAAAVAQHDSALNLLVRLRGDVGGRQFLFLLPRHSLALELGGAYTVDDGIFDATAADTNGDGRVSVWGDRTSFEKSGGVLAARIAVAYANTLVDGVSFSQTLELLPNLSIAADIPVVGTVDAPFEQARLDGDGRLGFGEATLANAVTTLSVQAGVGLALGVTLTFGYDAGAIARRNAMTTADATLAVQLGYRFF